MNCELLQTQTKDGFRLHGVLYDCALNRSSFNSRSLNRGAHHDGAINNPAQSDDARQGEDLDELRTGPVIVFVPGVGSNFYQSKILQKLIPVAHQQGYSVLSVNTRGHDFVYAHANPGGNPWQGSAFEIVSDCVFDIDAWISKCKSLGFSQIGLLGHSLGAIKSIYFGQQEQDSDLSWIVAASPSCLSYERFVKSNRAEEFLSTLKWAKDEIAAGQPYQLSEVTFPLKLIMSPATFADKYGEEEKYNILKFLQRVSVPLTVTFGQLEVDSSNPAFTNLDHDLIDLLGEDSAQSVRVFSDTDHHYSGKQVELAEYLLHWAQQLK